MKNIKMTREDWNSIGRRNGWLKEAGFVGEYYKSRGEPGKWRKREAEVISHDLNSQGAKDMIMNWCVENQRRHGIRWMSKDTCRVSEVKLRTGMEYLERWVPGGTEYGHRDHDLDGSAREYNDTVETKTRRVWSSLSARITCANGGKRLFSWVRHWDGEGAYKIYLDARGSYNPIGDAQSLLDSGYWDQWGDKTDNVNPPKKEKPRGLLSRIFGKWSSFDWETGKSA